MRLIKQFFYGTAFIVFVFVLGFGVWYLNREEPTCYDGIQNGQEEGTDCGLVACGMECPPRVVDLEIESAGVIKVADDEYDFLAVVANPNSRYGAGNIRYNMVLEDASGNELLVRSGNFFILPSQKKYIIIPSIKESGIVAGAKIEIKQVDWQGYDPVGTIRFPLRSQEREDKVSGSEFFGVITNDSDFDFDSVEVRVIVKNGSGHIIAVHAVPVLTLLAHSDRHFVVSWPYKIPDFLNADIVVESDTNLFRNSNFLRVYGEGYQSFQRFY